MEEMDFLLRGLFIIGQEIISDYIAVKVQRWQRIKKRRTRSEKGDWKRNISSKGYPHVINNIVFRLENRGIMKIPCFEVKECQYDEYFFETKLVLTNLACFIKKCVLCLLYHVANVSLLFLICS